MKKMGPKNMIKMLISVLLLIFSNSIVNIVDANIDNYSIVYSIPLSIFSTNPLGDPISIQGSVQMFNISLNGVSDINWYINGSQVKKDANVSFSSYTNSTASTGIYNVNVSVTDGSTIVSKEWIWTVIQQPQKNIPPTPNITGTSTGNFWINTSWIPGTGNITDSYNVSINGLWNNGTANYSNSTLQPHGWQNITIFAYNDSGSLSEFAATATKQIPDNPPIQDPIGNQAIDEGQLLNFTVHATDLDNDTITYGTNASKGSLNSITGLYTWQTTPSDIGIYNWNFNSTDGYGGIAIENVSITIRPISAISVIDPSANPSTILSDNGRSRSPGTNLTTLNVTVTGNVGKVVIDLSSIGGSDAAVMTNIQGTNVYSIVTNATAGINMTNNLRINATDINGNFNNSVSIPLTVLLRGDITGDGKVDLKDLLLQRKYIAGLYTPPDLKAFLFVGDISPDIGDGIIDLKDLLYLRKYLAGIVQTI